MFAFYRIEIHQLILFLSLIVAYKVGVGSKYEGIQILDGGLFSKYYSINKAKTEKN